jgi:hypothetical protein
MEIQKEKPQGYKGDAYILVNLKGNLSGIKDKENITVKNYPWICLMKKTYLIKGLEKISI